MLRKKGDSPRGFTLVEMLVVIAVIGLLLAIMLPALGAVRRKMRSAACQGRLQQIGLAMRMYVDSQGSAGRFPDVGQMPSLALPGQPTLISVLGPHLEDAQAVFGCPMDDKYFPVEGLSYEYRSAHLSGKTWQEAKTHPVTRKARPESQVMMLYDFQPFHGSANEVGGRNVVYMGGNVEPL